MIKETEVLNINADLLDGIVKEITATKGNHIIVVDNIKHPRDVNAFTKLLLNKLSSAKLVIKGGTKHRIFGDGFLIKVYRSNQNKHKLEKGLTHIIKWKPVPVNKQHNKPN